jgi:hypothetical protein
VEVVEVLVVVVGMLAGVFMFRPGRCFMYVLVGKMAGIMVEAVVVGVALGVLVVAHRM